MKIEKIVKVYYRLNSKDENNEMTYELSKLRKEMEKKLTKWDVYKEIRIQLYWKAFLLNNFLQKDIDNLSWKIDSVLRNAINNKENLMNCLMNDAPETKETKAMWVSTQKHLEDLMFDQGWFDDKFKDINALFVLQSMGE